MSQGALLIDGAWVQGQGTAFEKTNPVSNQQIWAGHEASSADVAQACDAARQAFPAWARLPIEDRIATIERFAGLLEQHKTQLAEVISQETSKPLWETLTEVQSMIGKVAISIRAYHQRTGFSETEMPDGVA
jgi:succinylglutamic semialdehyde dehydrogenase